MSKDRKLIATPTSQNHQQAAGDNTSELYQTTHNLPMNLGDRNAVVLEKEDDIGQIQQVSGGFGDSNNMDENML